MIFFSRLEIIMSHLSLLSSIFLSFLLFSSVSFFSSFLSFSLFFLLFVSEFHKILIFFNSEEVGVPSPPPFVDLLFAFLLRFLFSSLPLSLLPFSYSFFRSGNDIRWESFVLRIDTTLQVPLFLFSLSF